MTSDPAQAKHRKGLILKLTSVGRKGRRVGEPEAKCIRFRVLIRSLSLPAGSLRELWSCPLPWVKILTSTPTVLGFSLEMQEAFHCHRTRSLDKTLILGFASV